MTHNQYSAISHIMYVLFEADEEEDVLDYIQYYIDIGLTVEDVLLDLRTKLIRALEFEGIPYVETHWFSGCVLPPL